MAHYFLFILNFIKNERKGFVTVANIRINYLQSLGTQVHASDTGPDGFRIGSVFGFMDLGKLDEFCIEF